MSIVLTSNIGVNGVNVNIRGKGSLRSGAGVTGGAGRGTPGLGLESDVIRRVGRQAGRSAAVGPDPCKRPPPGHADARPAPRAASCRILPLAVGVHKSAGAWRERHGEHVHELVGAGISVAVASSIRRRCACGRARYRRPGAGDRSPRLGSGSADRGSSCAPLRRRDPPALRRAERAELRPDLDAVQPRAHGADPPGIEKHRER
jgi:hypothetical protein